MGELAAALLFGVGLVSRRPKKNPFVLEIGGRQSEGACISLSRCPSYGQEGRNDQLNQGGNRAARLRFKLRYLHLKCLLFWDPVPIQYLPPSGLSARQTQRGRIQAPQRLGQGTHADRAQNGATGELLRALTAGLGGTPLWRRGGSFFRWDRLKEVTQGWDGACRLWTGGAVRPRGTEWLEGCCCCRSRA